MIEWFGSGDPILLLHATGFHSRCWNEVVKHLPGRHIVAVDLRFHGSSDDVGAVDWDIMAEDIRVVIGQLGLVNLVGVGHSIGGRLIASVAASEPTAFKHLVLIDPVIMSPERYAHLQEALANAQPQDHPVSRRKNSWRDTSEMFDRFKDRAPFNTWQPAVLQDYCDYALRPADEHGLRQLACDPFNEAAIYLNRADHKKMLRDIATIRTPVTLLRAAPGDDNMPSLSTSPTWPGLAATLLNCEEIYLPQMNHFIPMQDPALVAKHIKAVE